MIDYNFKKYTESSPEVKLYLEIFPSDLREGMAKVINKVVDMRQRMAEGNQLNMPDMNEKREANFKKLIGMIRDEVVAVREGRVEGKPGEKEIHNV